MSSSASKSFQEWRKSKKEAALISEPVQEKIEDPPVVEAKPHRIIVRKLQDVQVPPLPRGFANFTRERNREVSAAGGRKAHELGKANIWNSETAKAAGRKGGMSHSKEHMREIGKLGAAARKAKRLLGV